MNKKEKVGHIKKLLRKKAPEFATRIAPIYAILNWQWYESGVPTRDRILRSLLEKIDKLGTKIGNMEITNTSSGGLKARVYPDIGGIGKDYWEGELSMDISETAYEDEEE